jgi:hypothetical protein
MERKQTSWRKGYPSPICASKDATDVNYDSAVQYMLDHLDIMSIFAGTHNEQSTRFNDDDEGKIDCCKR